MHYHMMKDYHQGNLQIICVTIADGKIKAPDKQKRKHFVGIVITIYSIFFSSLREWNTPSISL